MLIFNFSKIFFILGLFITTTLSSSILAGSDHKALGQPKPLSEFNLQNQDGEPFGLPQLNGHWSLVTVGFTSCPDVCPMVLYRLSAIREQLGMQMMPDSVPRVVFIAVDPDRDQAILKQYVEYFNPEYIGVTGEHDQIANLVVGLDAFYRIDRKSESDTQYNVVHSSSVYVINPEGEQVAVLRPPFHSSISSQFLAKIIRDYGSTTRVASHASNL